MFLRPLKTEQKKLFLGLAMKAAMTNKILEESEKQLLDAYADEMGIDPSDASDLDLDDLCERLKDISSVKELRQMTFEIIGMLLSDSEFDFDEKIFLKKVSNAFNIADEIIEEMKRLVDDYTTLIKRINDLCFSV